MRVRVGTVYTWNPTLWDACDKRTKSILVGTKLRVIKLHGCPPANTMGHCYVETLAGDFLGLVCTGSLQPLERVTRAQSGV